MAGRPCREGSHSSPWGGGGGATPPPGGRPPRCRSCAKCPGFRYAPSRPEECGQWHLPRRKDFDLVAWRKRVRRAPEEYSCIGCDKRVSEHETVFEPEAARRAAGRAVGPAFVPLAESPALQQMVLGADRGVVAL